MDDALAAANQGPKGQQNNASSTAGQGGHLFPFQEATQVHDLPSTSNTISPSASEHNRDSAGGTSAGGTLPAANAMPLPETSNANWAAAAAETGTDPRARSNIRGPDYILRPGQETNFTTHSLPSHYHSTPGPWHMRSARYLGYKTDSDAIGMPTGRVYVERLRPRLLLYPTPILLIQGEHHSSDVTKPDGRHGWASAFLVLGYEVVLLDLPPHGRSTGYGTFEYVCQDFAQIERESTASAACAPISWPSALRHDKWPGTGQRGDPVFANYCTGLNTAIASPAIQQTLSMAAIVSVLQWLGPVATILVGEGSGATAAWLAADQAPGLVAGIIAIEPDGPPFGDAVSHILGGSQPSGCTPVQTFSKRRYGISDIPLSFDPPAPDRVSGNGPGESTFADRSPHPFRLTRKKGATGRGESYLQDERQAGGDTDDPFTETDTASVRTLPNLSGFPHAIVTAEASRHSTYDWATVDFLTQAGVNVQWLELEKYGIRGNGHLCFLETNSNIIAKFLSSWIQQRIPCARPLGPLGQFPLHAAMPSRGAWTTLRPHSLDLADANTRTTSCEARTIASTASLTGSSVSRVQAEQPTQTPSLREVNCRYKELLGRSITSQPRSRERNLSQQRPMFPESLAVGQCTFPLGRESSSAWQSSSAQMGTPGGNMLFPSTSDSGSYFQPLNPGYQDFGSTYLGQTCLGLGPYSQMLDDASSLASNGAPSVLSIKGMQGFPTPAMAGLNPTWQPTMSLDYEMAPGFTQMNGYGHASVPSSQVHANSSRYMPQPGNRYPYIAESGIVPTVVPYDAEPTRSFGVGPQQDTIQSILPGSVSPGPILAHINGASLGRAPVQANRPPDIASQQLLLNTSGIAVGDYDPQASGSRRTRSTASQPETEEDVAVPGKQREEPQSPTGQYLKNQGQGSGGKSNARGRGRGRGPSGSAKRKRDNSTAPSSVVKQQREN